MRAVRWFALGIGLGVSGPAAGGDAPLAIGLRWTKGQTLTYRRVERDAMIYEAEAPAGADLPSDVRTTTFTLTVRDLAADGSAEVELIEATGPQPPVPAPVVPPPAGETLPKFEEFARQVQETCFVAPYDQTNSSLRSAAASEAECLRKRMVAELDRVLLPLKASDPAAFRALMSEQALWNSYVEAGCWLTEEAQWVDLDTRTRSDGTARGYAGIGCETQAAIGRGYYTRARRLGDARGFVDRIVAHGSSAQKIRAYVRRVRSTLAGKAKRPKSFPVERPLVSGEIEELLRKARTIEYTAGQLARASCRGWPALAEALGGVEACVTKAGPYYLAYGPSAE